MATIEFKTKIKTTGYAGTDETWEYVTIPAFKKSHCDMHAFRQHRKYGGYANSALFPAMLARIKREIFGTKNTIRLDAIPDGVKIDTSGFLAKITLEV